jgi:hypothetical protein
MLTICSASFATTARCSSLAMCASDSRSAYSGLVPMSPNTTPSAPSISANIFPCCACACDGAAVGPDALASLASLEEGGAGVAEDMLVA